MHFQDRQFCQNHHVSLLKKRSTLQVKIFLRLKTEMEESVGVMPVHEEKKKSSRPIIAP